MFFISTAFSQECMFTKRKIDSFTKKKVIIIGGEVQRNMFGPTYTMNFMLKDDSLRIELAFSNVSFVKKELIILKDEPMYIKLDNGSTVQLKALTDALESSINLEGTVVKMMEPMYSVTKDELQKISSGLVTGIRVVISGKDYDVEVKPKQGKKIQQALSCFLKEI